MTEATHRTQRTYARPDIVEYYDGVRDLQGAEEELFRRFIPDARDVLDIGIGAGRTTRFLAPRARRYVGIDLSAPMVERCRVHFPDLDLRCMSATDLSAFDDATFDAVVFSFNGLGTLPNDAARAACIAECARVLRPTGAFIFSLHNPRFVAYPPELRDVGVAKKAWRLAYSALQTTRNVYHRVPNAAFWRGFGYIVDPGQHDALTVYVASPERVQEEVARAGFVVREMRSAPKADRPRIATPHFYYACQRA